MPDLLQSLQSADIGQLHIIADLWGLPIKFSEVRQGRQKLAAALLDKTLVAEIVEALPQEARGALADLQASGGRQTWSQFIQKFGEVREMGSGRRDRQQPHFNPTSAAELLWYRALIARAFFETPNGTQEFVYLPEDLLPLLPRAGRQENVQLSRPATPAERGHPLPASDEILDHAATLLAALRLKFDHDQVEDISQDWGLTSATLTSLLAAAGLIAQDGAFLSGEIRAFLEAPRGEALSQLAQAWLSSHTHNDLHQIPHLRPEGEWFNDPLQSRQAVLSMLDRLGKDTWWSIPAFIAAVKTHRPDFQRPGGAYDSWYLKDTRTGEYLRGFEHWDAVDGALLRYLITGPLHWLGLLELAAPQEGAPPLAFRFSAWMPALLEGKPPTRLQTEAGGLQADSQGRIAVPRLTQRAIRYQIARFGEWDGLKKDQYIYKLTPHSLQRAERQGLKVSHLLSLLRKHGGSKLPPNLVRSLNRWQQHGAQARLETMLVLRLNHPEILQELRDSRAARYLGDPLGPTTVVVKAGAWEKVMAALAEMGYLCEVVTGENL